MKNKKFLTVLCILCLAVLLLIYLWRFQFGGYGRHISLDIADGSAVTIIEELEPYINSQERWSFTNLSVQELDVSDTQIQAVYSDFEKKYIFTANYNIQEHKLTFYINRTQKLIKPTLSYDEWIFDTNYFKQKAGEFFNYRIDGVWGQDTIYFTANSYSYKGNLVTGELIVH